VSMPLSAAVVFAVRMLAVRFNVLLPM